MNTIVLYRIDQAKRMQRFYRMDVQPDLFGNWCFIREWGRIGSTGRERSVPFPALTGTGRARQTAAREGVYRTPKLRHGRRDQWSRKVPPESQHDHQKKKMGRPRKYDEDFRQKALERMKTCQDISALALELGVNRSQLYRFQNEALGRAPVPRSESWLREKSDQRQRRRIAELERVVARQALELDFFKGALLRIEENRRKRGQNSGKPSTSKSGT